MQVEDAAFNRQCDRVRAVAGIQLGQDALHVHLDRFFGNHQVHADALVALATGHQLQHLHFALAQRTFMPMFGDTTGHRWRDAAPSLMHAADGRQQLLAQHAL
jgi:hypothetical protein